MNISELKDEVLSHYIDQDLQVTVTRDPGKWSTGNGLLHSGLFYTLLCIYGHVDDDDRKRFSECVDMCWVKHGLLNRNKGRPDHEAQDDYIGVCSASYFLKTNHAYYINGYGEDHHYIYDNEQPDHFSLSCWHGRFPGLPGFYALSARSCPGFLQSYMFKTSLSLVGVPPDSSTNILNWLKVQVALKQDQDLKQACNYWLKKLNSKYKTLGEMFLPYFGPTHPLSSLSVST